MPHFFVLELRQMRPRVSLEYFPTEEIKPVVMIEVPPCCFWFICLVYKIKLIDRWTVEQHDYVIQGTFLN